MGQWREEAYGAKACGAMEGGGIWGNGGRMTDTRDNQHKAKKSKKTSGRGPVQ